MRRIDSNELQIGMYVAKLDRPWLESPFLFQGFVVKDEDDLKELKRLCKFVYVDDVANHEENAAESVAVKSAAPGEREGPPLKNAPHPIPVEDEISEARNIRQRALKRFVGMIEQARLGKGIDAKLASKVVGDMVESLLRNPDALLLLRNISSYDTEAESHAISVSILGLTFGRYLGMSTIDLKELGIAALLHDIGETEVPLDILRNGPKNENEIELYNRHTELGARILKQHDTLPERVVDVALSHHEQINGDGYPNHLKGEEISYFARIVAIVNVYDHITLGSSGPSLPPAEALRYLYLYRDKFFDAELTEKFIQCLGVYPVGSLVELATGEVAIVISIPPDAHLYPRLLLVRDSHKKIYQPPHIMSLARFASSEYAEKYAIKRVLPAGSFDIDIASYLQQGRGL